MFLFIMRHHITIAKNMLLMTALLYTSGIVSKLILIIQCYWGVFFYCFITVSSTSKTAILKQWSVQYAHRVLGGSELTAVKS